MTNWFSGSANTRDILAHRHIEGTSNWFYAIGSTVKFKGGIPGSQEAEKQVELYAQCEPSNGCMCKCVGVSVHVYLCFCCCSFLYLHVNFCLCARVCMYLCLRSHVSIQDITITTHTYRACMMLQWYFGSTTDIVQRECDPCYGLGYEAKADLNVCGRYGTALHRAVKNGCTEVLKVILNKRVRNAFVFVLIWPHNQEHP